MLLLPDPTGMGTDGVVGVVSLGLSVCKGRGTVDMELVKVAVS